MNEVIEQPQAFVFTERTIQNGGKFNITEIIPLEGTPPEGLPRFRGSVQGPIGVKPNGDIVIGFKDFPIDADSGTEAFQMLPGLLKEAIDYLNRNAERLVAEEIEKDKPKKQIVVANQFSDLNNGDPRPQFPGVRTQSSKRRRRRSR